MYSDIERFMAAVTSIRRSIVDAVNSTPRIAPNSGMAGVEAPRPANDGLIVGTDYRRISLFDTNTRMGQLTSRLALAPVPRVILHALSGDSAVE